MKPRLRAEELTGMISLLRDKFVRSENLRRCCFVPMRRNSVFDGLRSSLFKFIQERMSLKVVVSDSRDRAAFVGVKRLIIPRCRTAKYKNSFFPSVVVSWNNLSNCDKLETLSLAQFKKSLFVKYGINRGQMFNSLHGFYSVMLTQIRLGLSKLRGDLFTFNLTENPICPLCLNAFECATALSVFVYIIDYPKK